MNLNPTKLASKIRDIPRHLSTDEQAGKRRIQINKGVISPPTDAGNEVIDSVRTIQADLGYQSPTCALPDRDQRHDPYKAYSFAQAAADTWRQMIRSQLASDINLTHVVSFLGGTGDPALMATDLPEQVTGRPVIKTNIASHTMRGTPKAAETRNTVVSYTLMRHKMQKAGYGHILLSNMHGRYGYSRFLDKLALFQALLPQFDTSDFEARAFTGACIEVEAGQTVDSLRESLEDGCYQLYRNPWFIPGDFNWVNPPEDPPLAGPEASRAFALLPSRFDGLFTDVNPDDAPELEPETAPIDNAYLLVIRPITDRFLNQMFTDTREWLFSEIADSESEVGAEVRRVVRLDRRAQDLSTDEVHDAFEALLDDMKNNQ